MRSIKSSSSRKSALTAVQVSGNVSRFWCFFFVFFYIAMASATTQQRYQVSMHLFASCARCALRCAAPVFAVQSFLLGVESSRIESSGVECGWWISAWHGMACMRASLQSLVHFSGLYSAAVRFVVATDKTFLDCCCCNCISPPWHRLTDWLRWCRCVVSRKRVGWSTNVRMMARVLFLSTEFFISFEQREGNSIFPFFFLFFA